MATSIYGSAKDLKDSTVQVVKHAAVKVNKSAHQNPWCYIGAAAIIGFFASGLFLRR